MSTSHKKNDEFYHNAGVTPKQFDAHWMPFSGNREFKQNPRMIVAANGAYLTAVSYTHLTLPTIYSV